MLGDGPGKAQIGQLGLGRRLAGDGLQAGPLDPPGILVLYQEPARDLPDGATVGIGAGQMSRLDSALIAAKKAERMAEALGLPEPLTKGCVVASDAFFPFPDGLLEAAAAGADCVIQPGGSMRDAEVVEAADEAGLAMVFTGMRHFRH